MSKVFGFCRNCKYRLTAVALEEKTEQPEFKQNLEQNIFSLLPPAQTEFLVTFLQNQGSIAVTAKEMLLTPEETTACLRKLLSVLGLELHEIPSEEPAEEPVAEEPLQEESESNEKEPFLFPLDKPIDAEFLQQFLHYPDGDDEEEEEVEQAAQPPAQESIQPAVFETLHKEDLQQLPTQTSPAPSRPPVYQQPAPVPVAPQPMQPPYQSTLNPAFPQQTPMQQAFGQGAAAQNWQPPVVQQPVVQPIQQPPAAPPQPIEQSDSKEEPTPLNEKALEEMMQNPLSEQDLQQVMQQSVSEELLQEVMGENYDSPKMTPTALKQQTITQPTHGNPYLTHSLKMSESTETVLPIAPSKPQAAPVSSKASERIRQKLNACGGTAEILSITKKPYHIFANRDGESFSCDKLSFEFNYEVFDIIVEFLQSKGGKADKGTAKGVKFGDPKCNQNTVVGIVAKKYFNAKKGDTVYDPISVLASILEWAEIAENCRGYIKLR